MSKKSKEQKKETVKVNKKKGNGPNKNNKENTIEQAVLARESSDFWGKRAQAFIDKVNSIENNPEEWDLTEELDAEIMKEYNELMARMKAEGELLKELKNKLLVFNNLDK